MKTNGRKLAVIGVGNMAKAIISGVLSSQINISDIILYDKNSDQCKDITSGLINITCARSISEAVMNADCVLISVKPQNYTEVLEEIEGMSGADKKLYISIGAGITSISVSEALGGACVIRVLPNVPMMIGHGVSVICENPKVSYDDFNFVCDVFRSAGSVILIDESEMNRIIGVTSSSPAYVFKFINAIYQGALSQGLDNKELLDSICDTVIGSALLLKGSEDAPRDLISRVASKGGTTERALHVLDDYKFDEAIIDAMKACTERADELGSEK